MPRRDLHNQVYFSQAITPQIATNSDTAIVSNILDTALFESAELILAYGTLTDANVTVAVTLDEGDDSALSDAAAVATGDMLGTLAGMAATYADDLKTFKLGYVGKKRYIRATVTPTGNNSGALPIAGLWAQSHARTLPQSTQKT